MNSQVDKISFDAHTFINWKMTRSLDNVNIYPRSLLSITQSILRKIWSYYQQPKNDKDIRVFIYSCNNINTTLIQTSRLFYFGFFSKTNHQMMMIVSRSKSKCHKAQKVQKYALNSQLHFKFWQTMTKLKMCVFLVSS